MSHKMEPVHCEDRDCPGCKMEAVIYHCHEKLNMHPDDLIEMFFDFLRDSYAEDCMFEMNIQRSEVTTH